MQEQVTGVVLSLHAAPAPVLLPLPTAPAPVSEDDFAAFVVAAGQEAQLIELLREDHPFYQRRGTATVVQMRGWVLLGLGRLGVSDETLVFILEELDTGIDPYLVAAAANALRSYPKPNSALPPFVMRALNQIRYRDDPVSLLAYADYSLGPEATSPVRELLLTLAWLGPYATSVLPELESIVKAGKLSRKAAIEAERTLQAIRTTDYQLDDCCSLPATLASKFFWPGKLRRNSESIATTIFEDQDGARISFGEFFTGRPSIVVFFYTRCDNPLKCSLTVTKLARVQKLLESNKLHEQIQTAAITYDPAFDLPERIRRYGENRDVRMDASHRMLRVIGDFDVLKKHFKLGVNFIESLVNRHRLEVFVLDREGRVAASFERLHWEEQEVVDRANEVLKEQDRALTRMTPALGTFASIAFALFPKCPICWAAYLSMLGVTGLSQIPYAPWLQPILILLMVANIVSVWWRGWSIRRTTGPLFVTLGALAILASKLNNVPTKLAIVGVVLTLLGSLLSVVSSRPQKRGERRAYVFSVFLCVSVSLR
jgi:protein SCO1/2